MTICEDTSCGTNMCGTYGYRFFPQGIHAKQARPGRTSSPGSERGRHHNARASLVTSLSSQGMLKVPAFGGLRPPRPARSRLLC